MYHSHYKVEVTLFTHQIITNSGLSSSSLRLLVHITFLLFVLGYKIPVIENLGATLDQFDTIDMSDNDIRKIDGFPLLKRLKCILFNNNRIV